MGESRGRPDLATPYLSAALGFIEPSDLAVEPVRSTVGPDADIAVEMAATQLRVRPRLPASRVVSTIWGWTLLVALGFVDVAWAFATKKAVGFRELVWAAVSLILLPAFFALLTKALLQIPPVGTAYAIWTGISAVVCADARIVVLVKPADAI